MKTVFEIITWKGEGQRGRRSGPFETRAAAERALIAALGSAVADQGRVVEKATEGEEVTEENKV